MDDAKIGLMLTTILFGSALFRKKKVEAAEAKILEEKPPLAVVPALIKAQDEGVPNTTPQVALPPVIQPTTPTPIVEPIPTPSPVSTGLTNQVLQKLQELTQKQTVPLTTTTTVIKEPIIETDKPSPTGTVPSIVKDPEASIVVDVKAPIPSTVEPTTKVAVVQPVPVVTTVPVVAPATLPEPVEHITLSDASIPFGAEIDRTIINPDMALGSWLSKQFKSIERHIRKEVKRVSEKVGAELKRAEQHVRKELKRTERRVRHELRRFEIRVRKNLSAIATVVSILGFIIPVLKLVAYALDSISSYRAFAEAKTIKKRIEGQQAYIAEVTSQTQSMLESPTKLATKAKGGTLGYIFKNRINSAFVPLISVSNTDLNDSFYTTIDTIPVLNAANYVPGKAVGFVSKVPFSGSAPLKLMYSFEMMDFVTVTGESKYFNELVSNGYIEVKQLGYVSKQPQGGPFTNKQLTEIDRIK